MGCTAHEVVTAWGVRVATYEAPAAYGVPAAHERMTRTYSMRCPEHEDAPHSKRWPNEEFAEYVVPADWGAHNA